MTARATAEAERLSATTRASAAELAAAATADREAAAALLEEAHRKLEDARRRAEGLATAALEAIADEAAARRAEVRALENERDSILAQRQDIGAHLINLQASLDLMAGLGGDPSLSTATPAADPTEKS
jgi:hypothetical protein